MSRHEDALRVIAGDVVTIYQEGWWWDSVDDLVDAMTAGEVVVDVIHGGEGEGSYTRHEMWLDNDDRAAVSALASDLLSELGEAA